MTSPASSQDVKRSFSRPEVEALKLWAFALALVIVCSGVYVIGESVMSTLEAGPRQDRAGLLTPSAYSRNDQARY